MSLRIVDSEAARRVSTRIAVPKVIEDLGFEREYVSDFPIGKGASHEVYRYSPPSTPASVLKIHRPSILGLRETADTEERKIGIIEGYFPNQSVPARVLRSDNSYLVQMDFVEGDHLSLQAASDYGDQLREMAARNAVMMQEAGMSLDLFGRDGVQDLVTMRAVRGKPSRVANVKITEDGSLKLVGYTLIPLRDPIGLVDAVKCITAYGLNRFLLGVG